MQKKVLILTQILDNHISEALAASRRKLRSEIHNNLALTLFKSSEFRRALYHVNAVLQFEPDNVKAMTRRCKIFAELCEFEAARAEITRLESMMKSDDEHQLVQSLEGLSLSTSSSTSSASSSHDANTLKRCVAQCTAYYQERFQQYSKITDKMLVKMATAIVPGLDSATC